MFLVNLFTFAFHNSPHEMWMYDRISRKKGDNLQKKLKIAKRASLSVDIRLCKCLSFPRNGNCCSSDKDSCPNCWKVRLFKVWSIIDVLNICLTNQITPNMEFLWNSILKWNFVKLLCNVSLYDCIKKWQTLYQKEITVHSTFAEESSQIGLRK